MITAFLAFRPTTSALLLVSLVVAALALAIVLAFGADIADAAPPRTPTGGSGS